MQLQGPRPARLVMAALLGVVVAAPHAFSQKAPQRPPRQGAAAADDQYNYISGLFEKGFHDLVVAESKKFLSSYADHSRAPLVRYRLGQSLFELKKHADARTELLKLEPTPRDFPYATEVTFRIAQCSLELGDAADAAKRFESVMNATGDQAGHYLVPAAAFYAGEARFRTGEFASAAKAYGKAAQSQDAEYSKNALYGMGWALYRSGEFETAATTFELFLQRHGKDGASGEAQFLLGECRLKQDKPAEALAAFQRVPAGEWQDDALSASGFACAALKDDAKAAQWFLRLEQSVPDSPLVNEARLHAGIHLQRAGKDDEAAAVLERLLSNDPGPFAAEAAYWRGITERRRGGASGAKGAVAWFDKALEAKPEKELAQRIALARADALFDAGDFDGAKEAYAKAGGSSEEATYSAAAAALNGGDFAGATKRAKDFLAKYPQGKRAPSANLVLGEALFAQEKWADALAAFDAAASGEARPRALSRAGWCCFKLGKFADAAPRFQALAKEFPKDERAAEASFLAGRALLRGGDAKSAQAAYEQFFQSFAESEWSDDARYDLAQCHRQLGNDEQAQKLLAEVSRGGNKVDPVVARRAALEAAEIHAAAGRHAEALSALAPVLVGDSPREVLRPALYAQAWSAYSLQKHDEANQALMRLFATEEKDAAIAPELAAPALELQVSVARARKDAAGARAAYDKLAKLAPEGARTPESALVAALALEESGDAAGAAALLDDTSKRFPKFEGRDRLLYQRALLLQKAGDDDQAKGLYAKLEKEFDKSPLASRAAFALGEQAYEAGDFDAAMAHYAKAGVEGSPVADSALYKSGWCDFQKQRFGEAAVKFLQVPEKFEKSPLAGESRYLAGESLFRAGKHERAADVLAEFVKLHPKHEQRSKALFRLGLAQGELGRHDECIDALSKLEREFPEFELKAEADLSLGRALLAKKRTNDALARFDAVIQADRGVLAARAHLGRGDVLFAQGKLDDALGEYLKVSLLFSSAPEVARSLWLAGQCLEQMGDKDKAKARYRELLERYAKSAEAEPARARLKELETKSF
jgi:TolA-binding protein